MVAWTAAYLDDKMVLKLDAKKVGEMVEPLVAVMASESVASSEILSDLKWGLQKVFYLALAMETRLG